MHHQHLGRPNARRSCLTNKRLCGCQLKKRMQKMYQSHIRQLQGPRELSRSLGGLRRPNPSNVAETPGRSGSRPAGGQPRMGMREHVKSVVAKTAELLNRTDGQRINDGDGTYEEIYQLYTSAHAENRKLRRTVQEGGYSGGDNASSSGASSDLDGSEEQYTGVVGRIYRLYKRTVQDNYRMQKLILSRSQRT